MVTANHRGPTDYHEAAKRNLQSRLCPVKKQSLTQRHANTLPKNNTVGDPLGKMTDTKTTIVGSSRSCKPSSKQASHSVPRLVLFNQTWQNRTVEKGKGASNCHQHMRTSFSPKSMDKYEEALNAMYAIINNLEFRIDSFASSS